MTGVAPIGAQVRRTSGLIISPLSSANAITAFRLRAFFNQFPVVIDPVFDLLLVALDGPGLGFLGAEAKSRENAANMIDVIPNAKFSFDKIGDPRTIP